MRIQIRNKLTETEFKKLYLNYYPVIYKVAFYILKHENAAEDIVQEVFLKIWDNQSALSEVDNIKAYLISMTRNASLDSIKKSKKDEHLVLQLQHLSNDSYNSDEEIAFRKVLEIAVSKLPPKCRLIFSLSRFDGLSNDEIAEYLKISKRTVETQISLALKAFRGDLRPIFETHLSEYMLASIVILLQQI
tara:strand:- start:79781 stop:80350 length:570 start_codon:yes stop_codon:yes gene_type:complete